MATIPSHHAAHSDGDHILWQLVDKHDEPRTHLRIPLGISVAFRNGRGQHCAAKLCNISPDGLQVRCNVATAQIIHPAGGRLTSENQAILQSSMTLPLGTGPETLAVCVRLLYLATVVEEPRCVLGFQFLDLRPKARRIIESYFEEQRYGHHDRAAN